MPSKAHGTKVMAQAKSLNAQRVAKPSLSLAPAYATRQAAYSCGPACFCRAGHSHAQPASSPAYYNRATHSCGPT
ncbi:hypothetical protein ACFX2C_034568 [Malus domestica]